MMYLYNALLYLVVPLLLARLLWRGIRVRGYWQRVEERLGYIASLPQGRLVWIHAVSVGEVQAALPLVQAVRKSFPRLPILITTTTPTGSQRVLSLFADQVYHSYTPYDLPGAIARFLRRAQPRLVVVMETELWPNLFLAVQRAGIPLVLANARMSERSAARYRRIPSLIQATLSAVSAVAAQGEGDAQRLISLGAAAQRVTVTGSIKFDVRRSASLDEEAQVVRRGWGADRPVWVAGSTHEGEEEMILDALGEIRKTLPECLLVLVPRHPERCGRVAALCRRRGLRTALRSQRLNAPPESTVLLGDTMGELVLLYSAADVAFVGGSLVAAGGHNPLEPAALGLPVVFGPHGSNFQEINAMLVREGAAHVVGDAGELGRLTLDLLQNAALRTEIGEAGRRLVESNRGALRAVLDILNPYLRNLEATSPN
jgi:3-deoxy-D-manno-octulosonic-acid transferase